ncbi:MAG: ornithine carbamoyltransferase [Phycisphaeraceae bacterium]|nr:ornithine carbamoyltransferase [Phycisphaeraceae bacterium]MCW5754412.1 ornithine carbamoyltransferase [Phycisphaeraceae bacterium]
MPATTINLLGRDMLSLADWKRHEIAAILDTACAIKADPASAASALAGRGAVLLFEKASLRTRVSFEIGIAKCGGHAMYFDHAENRIGQRESIKDYARNLERWVEVIIARTYLHDTVTELAEYAAIPVINALTDLDHPCQALADLLTLREQFGDLSGARPAFIGDGNNVCHALMLGCAVMGVPLTVITPRGFEPRYGVVQQAHALAAEHGTALTLSNDIGAIAGCNAVYTDTWVSMGQADEAGKRLAVFQPYQVNPALMAIAEPGAIFMHCLPAKRGVEVTDAVIDAQTSVVYDQAENRMHAQNALLIHILSGGL